ncbi:MAG: gamma-glutamyltransferase [Gammaproteobacteria bacterium]|nr:gamma-glutamyltransferase [Gammaproteobacteria bacterium]
MSRQLRVKAPWWSLLAFCLLFAPVRADVPGSNAVASAHPLATEAGLAVLAAGGNAFDAAVAVSAALAVVEPYGSGIGGGGFWLLHRASDGHQVMVDGRETAPLAATVDMYLDADGNVIPKASIDGALAAGIPGVPAALEHIASRYGRLPLALSLGPAIILAEQGFPIDDAYRRMAGFRLQALRASPGASAQFLVDGELPPSGHLLRQPQLAGTLRRIAREGAAGFYRGELAEQMVSGVRAAGGIWQLDDLAQYRVVEREPVVVSYRGHRIVSAALPSSGGIVLAQALHMLESRPVEALATASRVHVLAEMMRRAYADRARYLGDSDHVEVPRQRLLSRSHAYAQARGIDPHRATPSQALATPRAGGEDTTHFSILDRDGNRVAATLSVNYPFGAAFVVPGTGVLLNDEMDDFSAKPGAANAYGLVGNAANAIEPGKRMLSSMSPTFVEAPGRVTILGTPGGSRIISMVLLGILDAIAGYAPGDIVDRGRFHHQWLPDRIEVEPGTLDTHVIEQLRDMGHEVEVRDSRYGNMQVVQWRRFGGGVSAASDPRGIGAAAVEPAD